MSEIEVHRIVVTLQVEDVGEWERVFLGHYDFSKSQTATATHFTTTDRNDVIFYLEVEELDSFYQTLRSQEMMEAIATSGVRQETISVYVLDRELAPTST